ncbi:hypothetical protein SFRURICE_015480, partial [Spodoptera frugiperda]
SSEARSSSNIHSEIEESQAHTSSDVHPEIEEHQVNDSDIFEDCNIISSDRGNFDRQNKSYSSAWVNGVSVRSNFTQTILDHEKSQQHMNASLSYNNWLQGNTIDTLLQSEINSKITFWRDVLHRIINVIITLASCNLSLRGHDSNSGNFMAILRLLSNYDATLKELLLKPKGEINYLSPTIQNEIISLLGTTVRNNIISEIKKAPFLTIILDTTQDLSKIDQLSVVFRYISVTENDDNVPKEIKICDIKRWAMLSDDPSEKYLITLKKVCPTRWSSRNDALLAVKKNFLLIMKTLYQLNLISNKKDEREECKNIINILESYDFLVLVTFFSSLFEIINPISKALQHENNDLQKSSILLSNLLNRLCQLRNQISFNSLLNESKDLAKEWGVTTVFKNSRRKITKRFFDELSQDERISDPESYFKVNVYYCCLDILISQTKERFQSLCDLSSMFEILQPEKLLSSSNEEIFIASGKLSVKYSKDI